MNEFDVSAYLGVFLDEIDEQLQLLDESILKLEAEPANQEIIQNIFRVAHTLKGSSAAMGFSTMKDFTHQLESVFELIRQNKLEVSSDLISVLFESIDVLKLIKQSIVDNMTDEINITQYLTMLNTYLNNSEQQQDQVQSSAIAYDSYHKALIYKAHQQNVNCYEIGLVIDEDCTMKNVRAFMVFNSLMNTTDIIASNPSTEDIESEKEIGNELTIAIVTKCSDGEILDHLSNLSEIRVKSMKPIYFEEDPVISKTNVMTEDTNILQSKMATTVRVDVDKLEHLMNLVGELVIDQTRLVDVRGRFVEKTDGIEEEYEVLDDVTNHLSRIISELQEGMMKTRMMPIENLFNRFPRMVRDTATVAKKEISFVMSGKETELDRTLIEEISDPIIHLLRNAIDHGIEPPEERRLLNKEEKGLVTLSAAHEENHIVVTIEDDGRGIDVEKIKQKAIEKGLISQQEANSMNDKEALYLIFHSGLSTAKALSDISGRGVGMDIVKSHIEKLNGVIDIQTIINKGTKFTIKLPLTLAIIRSLLVKFGVQTFAIPLTNVQEIIRLDKNDIQMIHDQEVGLVRGRVLPLVRMRERLSIEKDPDEQLKDREFVVIVGNSEKRIGIIADRTVGNQEIVIKSLGNYIGSPPFITGATIMGDGNVALILDVGSIVRELGAEIDSDELTIETKRMEDEQQFVTFRLHNEEYAIQIQRVKDIITKPTIRPVVDGVNGLLGIIHLREQMVPVIDLRERIGCDKNALTKKARVIIVDFNEQEIGFLVDEVTQVLKINQDEMHLPNQSNQYNQSKLIKGITKVDERIIMALDFDQLISNELIDLKNVQTQLEMLNQEEIR